MVTVLWHCQSLDGMFYLWLSCSLELKPEQLYCTNHIETGCFVVEIIR